MSASGRSRLAWISGRSTSQRMQRMALPRFHEPQAEQNTEFAPGQAVRSIRT